MTRKDYVEFANALGLALSDAHDRSRAHVSGVTCAIAHIADVLAEDNGRFDHDRFLDAINYRARTGHLVRIGQKDFGSASKGGSNTMKDVPKDYPVQPVRAEEAARPATCGTCGRTWDDAIVTSMTPAPSARCPFEPFHDKDSESYA